MAGKSIQFEIGEVIRNEIGHLKNSISELKLKIETAVSEIGSLRAKEISDIKSELAVLKDRAARSGAIWGTVGGAFIAAMISAFFGLLHK